MNTGLLCGNSLRVTRDELRDISTPLSTPSWKPVPHHEVAELIVNEAENRGFCVVGEEYGLNPAGSKMFGVLRFHPEGHPEFSRALGVRNSHDKSLALGLTVGVNVLVCSNLCFGGETTIHRKHTSGIDLGDLIPTAFDNLEHQYIRLERNVDSLKVTSVTMDEAKLITVRAAEIKAIPSCDILTVLDAYKNPCHEEFAEQNRWCLFNAFTEIAKKYSPPRADQCYRQLGKLFALS